MTFNWIDYIFLAIFFISMVSGLLRGGVREVVALIAWVAAFVIASLFSKPLAMAFAGSGTTAQSAITSVSTGAFTTGAVGQPSMLALGVSFCVLFFGTLIIGGLIGYFLNRVVEGPGISFFNRILGAVFGLARGYLINLLIVFIVQLSPVSERTYWTESSLVKMFQPAVAWVGERVQPDLESLKSNMGQTLDKITTGVQNSMGELKKSGN